MGEVVLAIFKWIVRISFWGLVVTTWTIVTTTIILNALITINGSIINDIIAIAQIWAPFHINSVLAWIMLTTSAYLTYRLAVIAYGMLNDFIGKK